jgi:hypothetical protein
MDQQEALNYAATILEADQGASYRPDIDHSEAAKTLRLVAEDGELRTRLEAFASFGEEAE